MIYRPLNRRLGLHLCPSPTGLPNDRELRHGTRAHRVCIEFQIERPLEERVELLLGLCNVPKSAVDSTPAFPNFSMWSVGTSFCVRIAANLGSSFSMPEFGGNAVKANVVDEAPETARVEEAIAVIESPKETELSN